MFIRNFFVRNLRGVKNVFVFFNKFFVIILKVLLEFILGRLRYRENIIIVILIIIGFHFLITL